MPDADTTLTAVYLETGSVVDRKSLLATSSQVFAPGLAINAFNGVGLTGDLHGDTFPLGWMADGTVEKKWIKVDLGGENFARCLEWQPGQPNGINSAS